MFNQQKLNMVSWCSWFITWLSRSQGPRFEPGWNHLLNFIKVLDVYKWKRNSESIVQTTKHSTMGWNIFQFSILFVNKWKSELFWMILQYLMIMKELNSIAKYSLTMCFMNELIFWGKYFSFFFHFSFFKWTKFQTISFLNYLVLKKAAEGSFDQPTCKLWACRAATAPPRFHIY